MKQCYKCKARFYADSDITHTKIWYWADEGAADFALYHLHGSQHFMDRNIPHTQWKYPGELPGFTIVPGDNLNGPTGRKGCQIGKDEWFATGAPTGITRADVPVPLCCLPAEPISLDWNYVLQPIGAAQIDHFEVASRPGEYWLFGTVQTKLVPQPPPHPVRRFYYQQLSVDPPVWMSVYGIASADFTFPFTWLPDTSSGIITAGGIITFLQHWRDGVVAYDIATSYGSVAEAPSLVASAGDVLVCYYWGVDVYPNEPGMPLTPEITLQIVSEWALSGGYQLDLEPGPTGPRLFDLGISQQWTAVSILLR